MYHMFFENELYIFFIIHQVISFNLCERKILKCGLINFWIGLDWIGIFINRKNLKFKIYLKRLFKKLKLNLSL